MAPDADLLEFYQKQLAVPLHTVMHTFCKSKDAPSQHDASIHQHDQNRVYIYDYIYNIIITYIYIQYIYKSVWDCCRYFSQTQTWTHSTASGHEVAAWCWAVHLPGYRKAWTGLEVWKISQRLRSSRRECGAKSFVQCQVGSLCLASKAERNG